MKIIGIDDLLDLLYPPLCLGCNKFIDDREDEEGKRNPVCSDCLNRIDIIDQPYCLACRQTITGSNCSCGNPDSYPVISLGLYIDPLKEMIHQFKYYGYENLGHLLSDLLAESHIDFLKKITADAIIPIPLHQFREARRGFNQAGIIAEALASKINITTNNDILIKTKRTADQAKLGPQKRGKNIIGAFESVADSKVNTVILIDDVITTGATILEAIKSLKKANVEVGLICSLAVTGP